MIFKVLYQKSNKITPKRETTQALYLKANTEVEAREQLETKTDYNIEYIEPLRGNHLEYEEKSPDFKITELK